MSEVTWIKLDIDLFENPKIKDIRRLPDGNDVALFWVGILTMAGKCNSNGEIFVTRKVMFTPEKLADELKFEKEGFGKYAIDILIDYDMLMYEGDMLVVCDWEGHQNAEGLDKIREQTRNRVSRYRERHKDSAGNADVTLPVTECNATDKEEDTDSNIRAPEVAKSEPTEEKLKADFEIIYGIYPKKKGRTNAFAEYKQWVSKRGKDVGGKRYRLTNRQIYLAVKKYVAEQEQEGTDYQYWKNFDTLMGRQLLDYVAEDEG